MVRQDPKRYSLSSPYNGEREMVYNPDGEWINIEDYNELQDILKVSIEDYNELLDILEENKHAMINLTNTIASLKDIIVSKTKKYPSKP